MKQGNGAIRIGFACALLFASLSLVVWRQGRALEALRGLDAARAERALLQAQRAELQREIQQLESRARIVAVAGARLGLRLPAASEIVILQLPSYAQLPDTLALPRRPRSLHVCSGVTLMAARRSAIPVQHRARGAAPRCGAACCCWACC